MQMMKNKTYYKRTWKHYKSLLQLTYPNLSYARAYLTLPGATLGCESTLDSFMCSRAQLG